MESKELTIDNLSSDYRSLSSSLSYTREQFSQFEKDDELNLNFNQFLIAISKNGGLIAICKKKSTEDIDEYPKLNDNILIMYQDGKTKFFIPIDWDYDKEWLVNLEFNEKEHLYGISNKGNVYKFDLVNLRKRKKYFNDVLFKEEIIKAVLFEKGFMGLTPKGEFYYAKNIREGKNSKKDTVKFYQIKKEGVNDLTNVDFLVINNNKSKSGKVELIVNNIGGEGIIRVEDGKGNEGEIINNNFGQIKALTVSPSKNKIALLNNQGVVFVLNSNFDGDLSKIQKIKYSINKDLSESEIKSQEDTLTNYKSEYQFLFCGENTVVLSGQTFLFLINTKNENNNKNNNNTIHYKITEEEDSSNDFIFIKLVSEVDGVRYLSKNGVFFISEFSPELNSLCGSSLESVSKKLCSIYNDFLLQKANTEIEMRPLLSHLPSAIINLEIAAANIFWLEDKNMNKVRKDLQLFLLNVAHFTKSFLYKAKIKTNSINEFNYEEYLKICKDIRIIYNIRNHQSKPRLITYNEFKQTEIKSLLKKLLMQENYSLVSRILKYLNSTDEIVYENYAYNSIKLLPANCTIQQQEKLYHALVDKLKGIPGISIINISKKAFKYEKTELGIALLSQEKNVLKKLPLYLEKKRWVKALELAAESGDDNIINTVIEKIYLNDPVQKNFIHILMKCPKIKKNVIDFFNGRSEEIKEEQVDNYFVGLKNNEKYFFYRLEKFFLSKNIEERKQMLPKLKESEKVVEYNAVFDHKFYRYYLDFLEKSINFKIECLSKEKKIISTDESDKDENLAKDFDNSLYDLYKIGIKKDKIFWIEAQNNKNFDFNNKRMNYLKIKSMAEGGYFDEIDNLIKLSSLKKLGLSALNLAEIYLENNLYGKAIEYIKQINEPEYFWYKLDMLDYMDKLEDELEVICMEKIAEKDKNKATEVIKGILERKPELKTKFEEFCEKYKSSFNLDK